MKVRASHPRAARGRAGISWTAALITIGALFLVVVLISTSLVVVSATRSTKSSAPSIQRQPGATTWDDHKRLTVLLIGPASGSESAHPGGSLTLLSFDPSSRQVSLLAVPSSLWVRIPGYGEGRISEAYDDGGARLERLVMEQITHVPIPYDVVLSADTFRQMVDAFGGITIHVQQPINGLYAVGPRTNLHVHIATGSQHADGITALEFATMAPSLPGDVGRMRRREEALIGLMKAALGSQQIFRIPMVINSLGGSIQTNFPYNQVPRLAHELSGAAIRATRVTDLEVANGTVTGYGGHRKEVLLGDWQQIKTLAQRLFPDRALDTGGPVEVLNGSGVPDQAQSLALWLGQSNFRVSGYASAGSFHYAHTQVVMNRASRSSSPYVAQAVADLLGARLRSGRIKRSRAPVVVIIGHDYQDPTQR